MESPIRKGQFPGVYDCAAETQDYAQNKGTLVGVGGFTILRNGVDFDDLAPAIGYIAFTKNPVDSGPGEDSTTLSFEISDDTSAKWGYFTCEIWAGNANNRVIELGWTNSTIFSYQAYSTSAVSVVNPSTKRYTIDLQIQQGSPPGDYGCDFYSVDNLDNKKWFRDVAVIKVNRSGSNFDDLPPELAVSLQQEVLDVGVTGQTLHVKLNQRDESGSRWSYFECGKVGGAGRFLHIGYQAGKVHDYTTTRTLVGWTASGDQYDQTFELDFTIPFGSVPGKYSCAATVLDKLGHRADPNNILSFTVHRTPPGQPSSPTNLVFNATKPTAGSLSWTQPDNMGDPALVGYVTEYSLDGAAWLTLPKSGTKVTSLDVSGLKADTDYWFRVRGENGGTVGQDTSYMSLNWASLQIRTPKPIVAEAPSGLVVSDVTSNSYKFAWTAPSYNGGSAITDFTVEVSSDSGKSWKPAKQTISTSTSLSVSGAAAGTTYLVRVCAINGVGSSEYLTGSVTTLATKPSAPRTLASSKITAASLTLSWLLPSTNGGAAITDYKVELSSDGGNSWTVIKDGVSNNLAINVSGLRKNRTYQFKVSAINSAGVGDASASYSATTLATVPSTPTSLTVTELQTTSALLGWVAPSDFGGVNLSDYRVETSRDGKTWSAVPKLASTARALKLSGLAPGTQYQVRVSAVNGIGASDYLTGTVTTLATTPSVPRNVAISGISTSSATISWQVPATNGGSAISDYKIEVSSNCSTFTLLADGVSNNLGAQLSSLKPGLTYCVRVTAVNSIGSSETTPVLQVKTLDNKPSAPTTLAVKTASTSIVLSWSPASVGKGSNVINYLVEVSSNNGSSWSAISKAKSAKTSVSVSGLKSKRTYLFRVIAVNLAGTSAASKTLKVTTK